MRIAVDLHSHSGYAGGVGQIRLEDVSRTMKRKGIDLFGSGDCLFPIRTQELHSLLREKEPGLFALEGDTSRFLLQTEVILSTQIEGYPGRIVAHHVILFPDFRSIEAMQDIMSRRGDKNTIGRPFIVTRDQKELQERLFEIQDIDPYVEIVPAHVMTPDGIMGSRNGLRSIREFYGDFTENIRVIETGLSADPAMLATIPDFHGLTMISNSDCHSAALNRIGREFTILDANSLDYRSIIEALRGNRVALTAEFNPAEGRYFMTGHDKPNADIPHSIFYSEPPDDYRCTLCGKPMHQGVSDRCRSLQDPSLKPIPRKFLHLIPLVEVVAAGLGVRNPSSKRVGKIFEAIMSIYPSEIELWTSDEVQERLQSRIPNDILNAIVRVQQGRFRFDPPGYDGRYGELRI